MKMKLLMAAGLFAAFALSSCTSEDAKLAGELAGIWKGETTSMSGCKEHQHDKDEKHDHHGNCKADKADMGEMTCTPTLSFVKDDAINGGTVNISADYTLTKGVESIVTSTPVNATVSGTIAASGSWTVKDGDEVMITIDPAKTVVNVDSTSLSLACAKLTDAPQDSLVSLKEKVATNMESVIKPMLSARVQKMRKLDDVEISGNTMKAEMGHKKMNFTKQ